MDNYRLENMYTSFLNDTNTTDSPWWENSSSHNYGHDTEIIILPDPTTINIIMTIIYALVFIFGVTGNVLVIFVICRNPDMSTATNIFLVNLSIADLLVLLVCMPVGLIDLYSKDVWLLGGFMCKFISFLETAVANASVTTMLAISFERYYAICKPLEVLYTCTKGRAIKIIVGLWIASLVSAAPFFAISYTDMELFHDNTTNSVCRSPIDHTWKHIYNLGIFIGCFLVPCVILLVLYTSICRELLRSRKSMANQEVIGYSHGNNSVTKSGSIQFGGHMHWLDKKSSLVSSSNSTTHNQRDTNPFTNSCCISRKPRRQHGRTMQSRKQVIYMLITVIIFSFVCLLPFRGTTLWLVYSSESSKREVGLPAILVILHFSRICLYMNSAGNPILYNIMSTKFREASRRSLDLVCTNVKQPSPRGSVKSEMPSRYPSSTSTKRYDTTKAETTDESMTPLACQEHVSIVHKLTM